MGSLDGGSDPSHWQPPGDRGLELRLGFCRARPRFKFPGRLADTRPGPPSQDHASDPAFPDPAGQAELPRVLIAE